MRIADANRARVAAKARADAIALQKLQGSHVKARTTNDVKPYTIPRNRS
jgi:hypothetical protein